MATPGALTPGAVSASGSRIDIDLSSLGRLVPVSRSGGQGRVYAPEQPLRLASTPLVVKLYRASPAGSAALALGEMVAWGRGLPAEQRRSLYRVAAWPLATVSSHGAPVGIVMQDLRSRFELPFRMPSGRLTPVMLQLEHLLGPDDYLQQRGLQRSLNTRTRAEVAERICAAFAFLHRHGIVVSDVSPSNLLISLGPGRPQVTLIDCDSMLFRGRQALAPVQTCDWQIPAQYHERPTTQAADAYKLGLLVLRIFARESDASSLQGCRSHVPEELRGMITRALSADPASRPSALQWQRALRHVVADEHVVRRHPGPRGPVRRRPHAASVGGTPERRAHTPRAAPSFPLHARGAGGPRLGPRQPLFTTAWLIAGVLAVLLFMHLLAAAALRQNSPASQLPSSGEYRTFGGEGRPSEAARPDEEARPGEFAPSR